MPMITLMVLSMIIRLQNQEVSIRIRSEPIRLPIVIQIMLGTRVPRLERSMSELIQLHQSLPFLEKIQRMSIRVKLIMINEHLLLMMI